MNLKNSCLILYVGDDYLFPVADSPQGDLRRYSLDGETPFWLYFKEDADTMQLLYGKAFARPAREGRQACYGNFWTSAATGVQVELSGDKYPYVEMLQISGMLDDIREWFCNTVHWQRGNDVPAVVVFDDMIGHAARKQFLHLLEDNRFSIRSFSVPFYSLAASYCASIPGQALPDGESIMIASASGYHLSMEAMTEMGGMFIPCSDLKITDFDGENPVKSALARHVVDADNKEHGFFTREQCEAEYRYQLQYVDEWLEQAATEPGDTFVVSYHLSIDKEIKYTRTVRKDVIARSQRQEADRKIFSAISRYKRNAGLEHVGRYLFLGNLFSSRELFAFVQQQFGEKSAMHITSSKYPEILHVYMQSFPDLQEDLSAYDQIIRRKEQERNAAGTWSELSAGVTDLHGKLLKITPEFEKSVADFSSKVKIAVAQAMQKLEESDFDGARAILDQQRQQEDEVSGFADGDVKALAEEYLKNREIYASVADYPAAFRILDEIGKLMVRLHAAVTEAEESSGSLDAGYDELVRLETAYPEYRKLKIAFEQAQTLTDKRKLLAQMRPLTRELLPMDPDDVIAVKGKLSANIDFNKKAKAVRADLILEIGDVVSLPYNCVLVVSDKPVLQIDRSKVCFDIPRGSAGIVEKSVELPAPQFPKAKKLYVRLMVDRDKEPLYDSSKIDFDSIEASLEKTEKDSAQPVKTSGKKSKSWLWIAAAVLVVVAAAVWGVRFMQNGDIDRTDDFIAHSDSTSVQPAQHEEEDDANAGKNGESSNGQQTQSGENEPTRKDSVQTTKQPPALPVDPVAALKTKAEKGDKDAIRELGNMYYSGVDGVNKNLSEAKRFFEKLPSAEYKEESYKLANIYFDNGEYSAALERYTELISENYKIDIICDKIGDMYANGLGIEMDRDKALEWYQKASAEGNDSAAEKAWKLY